MAIICYSGRPGSGKTYSAVENTVLPALESGRSIVTNIPLNGSGIAEKYPDADITYIDLRSIGIGDSPFDLENQVQHRGAVFILDEIWKRWPHGKRPNEIDSREQTFFAEHRHYVGTNGLSTEIVLICQSINQITPFIRDLIDTTYITSKLDKVSADNRFRIDIYSGPIYLNRPDHNQHVRSIFGEYKSNVYQLYKSHTHNASGNKAGIEARADGRANIFKSKIFLVGIPVAIVLFAYSAYGLIQFLNPNEYTGDTDDKVPPGGLVSQSNKPHKTLLNKKTTDSIPYRSDNHGLPKSEVWSIVGFIQSETTGEGIVHLISTDSDKIRSLSLQDHCKVDVKIPTETTCVVDDTLVTYYTGESSSIL